MRGYCVQQVEGRMFCAKGSGKKASLHRCRYGTSYTRFSKLLSGFALGVKTIEATAPVLEEQFSASGFNSPILPVSALVWSNTILSCTVLYLHQGMVFQRAQPSHAYYYCRLRKPGRLVCSSPHQSHTSKYSYMCAAGPHSLAPLASIRRLCKNDHCSGGRVGVLHPTI